MRRVTVIVARDRPELYEYLKATFDGVEGVQYLSQRRCWALYLGVCFAISTVPYAARSLTLGEVGAYSRGRHPPR